jgi:hypothetical protein
VSVADMFAAQGRFVLIGAFVPLASFALFHLVTIFPLSWVTLFSDRSAGDFLLVQCAGAVVALGLSSKFGLGWVSVYLLSGAVCTLVALLFNKLETHESSGRSVAPATGPRSRGRESVSRAH